MKNLFNLTGSIVKTEVLVPIVQNIIENTCVSEACSPYANYYGQLPRKAKPNSLFFHTNKFYFLEEILSSAKGAEKCLLERINIASAHINFKGKQYAAIRIKNLADYTQITTLQTCLQNKGIEFTDHINIEGEVNTRISKLFVLEEFSNEIYMDLEEKHKGYFFYNKRISALNFKQIINTIRNSTACKLFDAEQGEIIQNGNVFEIVRIFAEGLEVSFLSCLKKEFIKQLSFQKLEL